MSRASMLASAVVVLLTGCVAGNTAYTPPPAPTPSTPSNIRAFDTPIDRVWQALSSYASQNFFVVDNIEKDSYFMNLSFSAADPTEYIDCGRITSSVKNLRGERTYDFESAKASQQFEASEGGNLYGISRTVQLNGKINVFLTKLTDSTTSGRVNVRYVVTRQVQVRDVMGKEAPPTTITFSFSSGGRGSGELMQCQPKNVLEASILDGISAALPQR